MSDYDPRTDTGIPTEPVGSLPGRAACRRPTRSTTRARSPRTTSRSSRTRPCKDSIERGEATGSPIISDGEQRWSSFATYPIADTLAGTGLAREPRRRRPVLRDLRRRPRPPAAQAHRRPVQVQRPTPPTRWRSRSRYATKPMKQAVIAPSMLALLYPLKDRSRATRARSSRRTSSTRARRTSARPSRPAPRASRSTSPRAGWRPARIRATRGPGRACCRTSSSSTTACWPNFSAEERTKIGIHTCPGGDRDSVHRADVPYNNLLPEMFKINAGYFLIQLARARQGPGVRVDRRAQPRRRNGVRRCATSA